MILTRKLLLPASVIFATFLAGLFVYFFSSLHQAYHEAEEVRLTDLSNSFNVEIEHQKQLALSLARTAADNPAIQAALASRDVERLRALVVPGFSMLQDTGVHISQNRYYLPDGSVFFSANESETTNDSDDTALFTNSEQASVSGLEIQDGAPVILAIAPIYFEGRHIGRVEFQTSLTSTLLQGLEEKYGANWRILLLRNLVPTEAGTEAGPHKDLVIVSQTQGAALFNAPESYQQALAGTLSVTHPSRDGRDYTLQSSPIYDNAGRIVGVLDIVYDHTHISASQNTRLLFAAAASTIVLIVGLLALFLLIRKTLQPIQVLTRAAAEISEGNSMAYVNVKAENDEVGILIDAFNRMTSQLRGSIADLERRVAERTRDLEEQSRRLRLAAEISQSSLSVKRLDELLDRSAHSILERFNYYHVGIFLIDAENKYVSLAASPTDAGKQMIDAKYRVAIGDAHPVGRAAATGEPRIVSEITPDGVNPLLPDARAELALPLKMEERVIGILDILSAAPQAFKTEDISVMLVLADQLASAIERIRLLEESTNTLGELERAYGRFTRAGWQEYVSSGRVRQLGYRFDNIRLEPLKQLSISGREALQKGDTVVSHGNGGNQEVAIPIKFRGQTIGVVHAKLREGYGEGAISTLELAVDRLASSLESARLYEEARLRADREQAISQITTAISSSSDYETILRTTVREIGHALADTEVGIQILGDVGQGKTDEEKN
ncbi:MAG: GAF domain-containing protein [Anaerolineales bacterium]|nr:GAF domain-containing protein [Anaerolineales bacterium]